MAASLASHVKGLETLLKKSGGGGRDGKDAIAKIKLHVIRRHAFAGPQGLRSPQHREEARLARRGLEIGCVLCVRNKDMAAFEKNFSQLSPYYAKEDDAPSDNLTTTVLGLNLLRLLTEKRLPEFHSALERISFKVRESEKNVAFPVRLERFLQAGDFSQFFKASKKLPNPEFGAFMEPLVHSAREEIVSCCAEAYADIKMNELQGMMGLEGNPELARDYVRRLGSDRARVDNDGVARFTRQSNQQKDAQGERNASKKDISAWVLAKQSLLYATELERIV